MDNDGVKKTKEKRTMMHRSWSSGDIGSVDEFCDPYMDPLYYHHHHGVKFSWWEMHGVQLRNGVVVFIGFLAFVVLFCCVFYITLQTSRYASEEREANVIIEWYGCSAEHQSAMVVNPMYKSRTKYIGDVFSKMEDDSISNMQDLLSSSLSKEDVKRYCKNVTMEITTKAMNSIKKKKKASSLGGKFVRK